MKTSAAHRARNRRWYYRNHDRALELARKYARRQRAARALRERQRYAQRLLTDPHYSRDKQRAYVARNPGASRAYRARVRLRRAWSRWVAVCAMGRAVA